MKTALITGISGQDGCYLAKFLLSKNYKVVGLDRRSSRDSSWRLNYLGIINEIVIEYADLLETGSLQRIFDKYDIDEVYNLAAQSFVGTSFNTPITTCDVNSLGVLRMLEIIRNNKKKIKFYQASSSEMYGDVLKIPQNELTPFNPQSPYAISKLFSHFIVKNYRQSYGIFACSGILFNHESPLRGEEFVTRKITTGLSQIMAGKKKILKLGNIYAKRDWGYAPEYVEAMWKMLQKNQADDYVISTNKSFTIKYFINQAAKHFNMKLIWRGKGLNEHAINIKNNKIIIKIDPKFYRPAEVNILLGDSKKAQKILKWKSKVNINELIKIMAEADINRILK
jgi:GDPmannose 4,6-dehydratase